MDSVRDAVTLGGVRAATLSFSTAQFMSSWVVVCQSQWLTNMERKLGAYAMKRVAAGSHLPTPWFLSLPNAQTIEPTSAWPAVSTTSAIARYSFSRLSGLWRILWANSCEDSAK